MSDRALPPLPRLIEDGLVRIERLPDYMRRVAERESMMLEEIARLRRAYEAHDLQQLQ